MSEKVELNTPIRVTPESIVFRNDWKGPSGTVYYFSIRFTNGLEAQFSSSKDPQVKFVPGEEVDVIVRERVHKGTGDKYFFVDKARESTYNPYLHKSKKWEFDRLDWINKIISTSQKLAMVVNSTCFRVDDIPKFSYEIFMVGTTIFGDVTEENEKKMINFMATLNQIVELLQTAPTANLFADFNKLKNVIIDFSKYHFQAVDMVIKKLDDKK